MEEKPATAEPRRRWYQFGLRTLFVAVMLVSVLAAFVGWERHFIRQRQAALVWLKNGGGWAITTAEYDQLPNQPPNDPSGPSRQIPAWRSWLGDEPIASIGFEPKTSRADRQRVGQLFPEAEISTQ